MSDFILKTNLSCDEASLFNVAQFIASLEHLFVNASAAFDLLLYI